MAQLCATSNGFAGDHAAAKGVDRRRRDERGSVPRPYRWWIAGNLQRRSLVILLLPTCEVAVLIFVWVNTLYCRSDDGEGNSAADVTAQTAAYLLWRACTRTQQS